MDIKPIKNEKDYNSALAEIERLMDSEANTSAGDKLDVLTTLVEAYEEKHYPVDPPDPIEAIIHQMESQGITRKDLEQYIGNRARVSEVLNRKRSLSINMIRNLQKGLGISAEILIRPYSLNTSDLNADIDQPSSR